MAAPFFGSASSMWPAIPAPGFVFQPQIPSGPRPFGSMSPGTFTGPQGPGGFQSGPAGLPTPNTPLADPYAMASGMFAGGPGFGPGLPAAMTPMGAPYPTFTGAEIASGVPAAALLTAVALRRGQPVGPTNDQEIEDFIYDALDLLPGANEVEARCESGRVTLTGTVPHKRVKREVGEIAWAFSSVNDVQNNVTITARRRSRGPSRESEPPPAPTARKQT